jgi:flavin-dependent thymidylate synthase
MGTDVTKWGDQHQFVAEPMRATRTDEGHIIPRVHLVWMTPDPLGAVAALCRMYVGEPTYSLGDITDEERLRYLEQVQKTHLKAPLEAIKLHFFIEGVTRSFTHQMVRQRTAVYAQESMRFAVKENMADELSLPPSLAALPAKDHRREVWDRAVAVVSEAYNYLVANGIPAEDARGLAPHATTTRLHYVTDLRNLAEHAGNRLCTQAQFEWRIVFMGIVNAIRHYGSDHLDHSGDDWQFEAIADSGMFRPICYQLGKCMFEADFDRSCTIRSRVDKLGSLQVPSAHWHEVGGEDRIAPEEWLADPGAARKTSGGGGHD